MLTDIVNLSFDLLDLRQVADGLGWCSSVCRLSWWRKGSVIASHIPFSSFGSRQVRLTVFCFFFSFCTWGTWHLAAGSFARQMSVIDIQGMRLDFMNCLLKKEMSSMTENGINGGKRRDNQTRSNRHSQWRLDSVLCSDLPSGALCFQRVLLLRVQGKIIQGQAFLNPGMSLTGPETHCWKTLLEWHFQLCIIDLGSFFFFFFDQCHYWSYLLARLVLLI